MSLTQEDLQQIEAIFDRKLNPVLGELTALREDIKEVYGMPASSNEKLLFHESSWTPKNLYT